VSVKYSKGHVCAKWYELFFEHFERNRIFVVLRESEMCPAEAWSCPSFSAGICRLKIPWIPAWRMASGSVIYPHIFTLKIAKF
jgi:hypothetical protein